MSRQANGIKTNHTIYIGDRENEEICDRKRSQSMPNGDSDARMNLLHADQDRDGEKKVTIEYGKFGKTPEELAKLEEDEYWTDEDEEEDVEAKKSTLVGQVIVTGQQTLLRSFVWLKLRTGGYLVTALCLIAYIVYFTWAMIHEFGSEASRRLLIGTVLGVIIYTRHYISKGARFVARKVYGQDYLSSSHAERLECIRFFLRWAMYGLMLGVIAWTLIHQGMKDVTNLRPVPGLFAFLLFCLLFSSNPSKINWHTIFWGVGLQFLTALFILKFDFGKNAVLWVQNRLDEFFANSDGGSKIMFGDSYKDHYIIFGALPLVLVSNATLTILYYTGAMILIIKTIGSFLSFVLDTSPVESMGVAASIFLEGVTAILSLRPYLRKMSKSQLFLMTTSAFSSLGGAYLAILSSMGVSLTYLIPAMVISAPATFAVCKLIVPETKVKQGKDTSGEVDVGADERNKYIGIMDAAQTGAMSMVSLVVNIVVVAFVFFFYIEWLNHTLQWFGERVGLGGVNVELLSAYAFYPAALAMGIEPRDCYRVAMLLGYRFSVTNIVAFFKLTDMSMNRNRFMEYMQATNGTGAVSYTVDDITLIGWNETLKNGFMSIRSEAVVTYALSGFSSFLTVMITMGVMITLVPRRKAWINRISLTALIAGNIANCMTGCFAGIFYE
ncbi:solute carrier family 28 member 3-like [Plakobranchus ocellatus]|uniref:Solute carrier family 28 member 3-like n=1 Tax=Plakobranchus ocellatus TaxID=259542 RepID=A0AAV3XWY3_9GAST|nr:solute carrier family 28 member 3-like [Plakobranchus ocellatus]